MEKSKLKKDKKKEKKSKSKKDLEDKDEKDSTFVINVVGVPGSNLPSFYKSLARSLNLNLSTTDSATLTFVEYFKYWHDQSAIQRRETEPSESSLAAISRIDISELPTEVLYIMASYIQPRDCLSLQLVNKRLHQVYEDPSIWRRYWIKNGVMDSTHELTTTFDFKTAAFTSGWALKYQQLQQREDEDPSYIFWEFHAVPAEIYRRNYAYSKSLFTVVVIDLSKYDLELTEEDGTKIKYFDKCRDFIAEITTRPNGPVTDLASVRWPNVHQPKIPEYLSIIFTGARTLKDRLDNGYKFPPELAEVCDPNVEALTAYLKQSITTNLTNVDQVLYIYQQEPTFSLLFNVAKDIVIARGLLEAGFGKKKKDSNDKKKKEK